jgi:RND family efflux transporter MFP subunit
MLKKLKSPHDLLKTHKLPAGIFLIGAITLMVLVYAKPIPEPVQDADSDQRVKVAVTQSRQQTVRLAVTAHGTVFPKREIDLIAQVSGQIVHVEPIFVDGGFFNSSQVLIRIDDRDYKAALLNARARLAEAARVLAEEEGRSRVAEREWRELGNKKANELFVRKPHLAAAQANVASAEGDVARAELNIERTKITVPFDGRIKQIHADLGQYVTVGSRVATVYDSTVVEVRLPLTERQASLINLPLTPAQPEETPVEGISILDGLPLVNITGSVAGETYQWQGVLTRTDAFVDADSRMYYAVVEVHNPFGTADEARAPLLPGLFVKAEIGGKEIDDVVVLPRSALFQQDKIITLDAANSVGHRSVNVLRKSDSHVWVQAELADNTLVAIEKQSLTPEGSIVEPLLNGSDASIAISDITTPVTE